MYFLQTPKTIDINSTQKQDYAENAQKAKEEELAAEMKIYESYIVGMLRNFSTLPVDRIHDMLKMFVSTGEHKYDKKIGDLQLFLNQLCAEEKIETDGVLFSLPKNRHN